MNTTIIMQLLFMAVIFYFLLIRPQQQKAKKEKSFEATLKVGDKVITKAGIHGKIAEISDGTVVIETMAGKIKMEKSALSMEMTAKLNEKK
ncbi:preprotein translocase subunit YajC [Flavobacterium sp. NRK F10]|uniref:Sec translocon accessory complex subunit YajC n=1 Tax=Flavobacterium sediminis TaxID=2201181 RepID=A0A2U8QX81_9FLAO|nr:MULTISPECIES: preprotein translocase subunit YajC [Flavobacterium]AWM14778.1 preprotein translocase subunit YajC [Flavobacterium sediminis]MCO6176023.1 preprotein translocase subunit YajC [Flavobacterium sp. NRK F10]